VLPLRSWKLYALTFGLVVCGGRRSLRYQVVLACSAQFVVAIRRDDRSPAQAYLAISRL
jgi:hypothetical protein